MAGQGSDGRRIAIEKVPEKDKRLVIFSKRRYGLEKKTSELVPLTGAHVAIIVFSPGRKVFMFGHPSVDEVIRRFLDEEPAEPGTQIVQAYQSSVLNQLYFHLNQLHDLIDEEQSKGEEINLEGGETEGKDWWERPTEELSVQQLELLMVKMREFKHSVDEEIRLIQPEEEELNGGVPVHVHVHVHVPSNVMGGGTDVGPVHDPKGNGPAHKVSFDPMVGGSSSRPPLDPRVPGFDGGVPYVPTLLGPSNQTPLGPTFGAGVPVDPGTLGFCTNPSGFQDGGLLDPNAPGPNNGGDDWSFIDVEATDINQAYAQ